jgi:hypothetical protein
VSLRKLILVGATALTLFTAFDHGMRLDQRAMCDRDAAACPDSLWWFK